MRPTERQNLIVDHVEKHGSVTVDFAQTLTISRETIRRDLSALADRGQICKFHGGARMVSAIPPDQIGEGQFHARMRENVPQKRRIARAAAALFKPGDFFYRYRKHDSLLRGGAQKAIGAYRDNQFVHDCTSCQ